MSQPCFCGKKETAMISWFL